MRVVVVKQEDNLVPLIVSEEETVDDLISKWKETTDSYGDFVIKTVDSSSCISADTCISELPLPLPGYSSIEVTIEKMSTLTICAADDIEPFVVSIPLSATLHELEVACCKEIKCSHREMVFFKNGVKLNRNGESLMEQSISNGDALTADIRFHFSILSSGSDKENENAICELWGKDKMMELLDKNIPYSEQRLYHEDRLIDLHESVARVFGLSGGEDRNSSIEISLLKKMTLQVLPPPSEKNGFSEPTAHVVSVWPNKPIACLLRNKKPDIMIWRDGVKLSPDQTFSQYGICDNDVLSIDRVITVRVKVNENNIHSIDVKRTATVHELIKRVRAVTDVINFQLFFQNNPLVPESRLLRLFGVRNDSLVDVKLQSIDVILKYEDKEYEAGRFSVGSSFATILSNVENILGCGLPANTYLQCQCGRKLSQEEEFQRTYLPLSCCSAKVRMLTVHRLVDCKITEMLNGKTQHVRVDSMGSIADVLNELKLIGGCQLYYRDALVPLLSPLRQYYQNNRVALTLEKKIAVIVTVNGNVQVRLVWPSSSLAALVNSLMRHLRRGRTEVLLGDKILASYGVKPSACSKTLTDYGITDGSVLCVRTKEEEVFASFKIICNQWHMDDFEISVPVPVMSEDVSAAVMDKFKSIRPGSVPLLAQIQGRDSRGQILLFTASNVWVNKSGEAVVPVYPPKFYPLDEIVDFVPSRSTKIFLRKWFD